MHALKLAQEGVPTVPYGAVSIGELRLLSHRELRRGEEPLAIGGRALDCAQSSGSQPDFRRN